MQSSIMSKGMNHWLARINDSSITHKEKYPGALTTYTQHGYVPIDTNVVSEGCRDYHLVAYMQSLIEIRQWDKSVPSSILFAE